MNSPVQPVQSLKSRLKQYRKHRREYVLFEALPILILGIALPMAGLYAVDRWAGPYPNWPFIALISGICLAIPPLLAIMPRRPSEKDVHEDQLLRRFYGLDDKVSDSNVDRNRVI